MSSFLRSLLAAALTLSALTLALLCAPAQAIRSLPPQVASAGDGTAQPLPRFAEAPEFRNGPACGVSAAGPCGTCDPTHVHVAMTLDMEYLRGSMAAVLSVLKHASCPENAFFHFVTTDRARFTPLARLVRSTFPYLRFKMYYFDAAVVEGLISTSVRAALENPLNYARSYLDELLEPCVSRVIYLDSDLVVVDDIEHLWNITLSGDRAIGAPEYCRANFTKYFTEGFWAAREMGVAVFAGRRPCYFNTGVMVMDLGRWRRGRFRERIEGWMRVQKERRIYELGSLPPFLLVFAGDVEAVDHRWNQHGLGGDNVSGSCRLLHSGPVSLLHWSGKGKPWARLDAGRPCPLDRLWEPYDLHLPPR